MSDDLVKNLSTRNVNHVDADIWMMDAAARIAALEADRDEWKKAATGRHPNPADFRYWEGRYRDEKDRADRLEAEVARLREALEGD